MSIVRERGPPLYLLTHSFLFQQAEINIYVYGGPAVSAAGMAEVRLLLLHVRNVHERIRSFYESS